MAGRNVQPRLGPLRFISQYHLSLAKFKLCASGSAIRRRFGDSALVSVTNYDYDEINRDCTVTFPL